MIFKARALCWAAVGVLVGTMATACSSGGGSAAPSSPSGSSGTPSASGAQSALHDQLPDAVKSAGVLKIAITSTSPPANFLDKDGKTLIGYWPDVLVAMGKELGVKMEINIVPFASLLTGIQSGRYDVGANLADTAEREKTVDFIDLTASQQVYIAKSSADFTSTCGKKVAVPGGSLAAMTIQGLSDGCVSAGNPKITVSTFGNYDEAMLALTSDRVDAVLHAADFAGYTAKQSNGALKLIGQPFDPKPLGFVVNKDSGTLKDALLAAGEALKDNGTFKQVLDTWGAPIPDPWNMGINLTTKS